MNEVCRICEREDETVVYSVGKVVADVKLIAQINLSLHDYLPSKVCATCVRKLKEAVAFRQLCRRSEENVLANYLLVDDASAQLVLPSGKPIKTEINDIAWDTVGSIVGAQMTGDETLPVVVSYEEVMEVSNSGVLTKVEYTLDDDDCREYDYEDVEVLDEVILPEILPPQPVKRPRRRRQPGEAPRKRLHDKIILPPTGPYHCEPCNKMYEKKTSFLSHYRDFHDRNPRRFVCDICGVAYTRDVALQGHLNVHYNQKPFKCDICGMGFARKYGVQNHMRSHTKEKKFFCKHCGKGFSFLTDVKRHETVHTGVYLYNCGYCKKGFNRKKALQEHELEHNVKLE